MLVDEFEALNANQRRSVALVEYHCAAKDRCRLLTIWQRPSGRFWYLPAYKLSEAVAVSETAESARAKRTKDGLQRWQSKAGSLDELFDFAEGPCDGLSVNCRHLRNHLVSWCELKAHSEAATPGAPLWITLP